MQTASRNQVFDAQRASKICKVRQENRDFRPLKYAKSVKPYREHPGSYPRVRGKEGWRPFVKEQLRDDELAQACVILALSFRELN